ncbi:MAG: HD-GYP domain-containing protein [Nitrospinae bacterium]|nr:HD-GYP domain-containing protein [Nitrospinota bacterium]
MIKKVKTEQLQPGMYIHDFDCGWMEVPFMRRSLMVTDDAMVQKILANHIREVYIDTARGKDVADALPLAEVKKVVEKEIMAVAKEAIREDAPLSFMEEVTKAKEVRDEAKKVVTSIMGDVKLGKQVDFAVVDDAANNLVDSVFRNSSALVCLSQLKSRDEYTFQHSVNVCILMISFCRAMKMEKEKVREVATGALLHDLGKMKVPDEVLNKAGKLSDGEFDMMKSHVLLGKTSVKNFNDISANAVSVMIQHHERFDGSGYPFKLKGEEITPIGQMASVVDVYDAITSDRCYHKGLTPSEALRKMYEWAQYHFKKEMVEHFIKCVGIYPSGSLVRLESGFLALVLEPSAKGTHLPKVRLVYDPRKNAKIRPKDVDLSDPDHGHGKITGYEKADAYGINLLQYMGMA